MEGSALAHLFITDSIAQPKAVRASKKIETISIAPLMGEAIGRIAQARSVSSLFD
ncbi:MAG: hypothetical protein OXB87_00780 [Hyphomicrobiales bacterium]|nr:hypothetical protein [Hyphomicrobiales bacterium]